jgi:hypothetical protein
MRGRQPRAAYSFWSPESGFLPHAQPLPLYDAVRQLPRRYRLILSRPGFESFLPELGLAGWNIVCFQLLIYTVGAAGLAVVRTWLSPEPAGGSGGTGGFNNPAVVQVLTLGTSSGLLFFIPLLFFFAMGLLYWLARASGGHGTFVQQVYTTLLFVTPCGLIVSMLGLLPLAGDFLSAFLGVILFVYCVVLQCFATVAVHQLKGEKATAITVITTLSLILASILCLVCWTLLAGLLKGAL